jgi:hypothetical protein
MSDISDDERQEAVWDNPDAITRMDPKAPDFTVTGAHIQYSDNHCICIAWETKSAGFGTLTLVNPQRNSRKWNQLRIDGEGMSRSFMKEVLAKLVDDAECV